MSCPPRLKPLSEKKREREVLQYVAAYRDLPHLDELASGPETVHLPSTYDAQHSTDSTLLALCQLAALRMNAQRALVSLIDDRHQHILAEATPRTSLRSTGSSSDKNNQLWLGRVTIPRSWGICEQVLGLDTAHNAVGARTSVIIEDLLHSDQHAQRTYVRDGVRVRFYAGAALVSPNGAIVGALCVFDDAPRQLGVSHEDVIFLEDLAATVTEYLGTYTVRDRYKRGEKLTRGLISFAEGASALLPLDNDGHFNYEPDSLSTTTSSSAGSNAETQSLINKPVETHLQTSATESNVGASQAGSRNDSSGGKQQHLSAGSDTIRARSTRDTSLRALQNTILPMNSRSMFARAANVMLASSELDGVLILDASVAATGHRQHPAGPENGRYNSDASNDAALDSKSGSSEDSSSQSSSTNKTTASSTSKKCQILGAAPPRSMINADGTLGSGSLAETNLARLLREHPYGKVFNFSATGASMSSTDDSNSDKGYSSVPTNPSARPQAQPGRRRGQASRNSNAISGLLPQARSVAFVPFWDYERSRWFAGCLCWTNDPDRLLSTSVDLAYFNIFSHSIMRELSRLDALALNQQKTTFVASISHELRSPLHGILGTLEFIRDTPLDTFQISMLNSLNSCGQTLLDTINHVMDHSKMSEATKNVSSKRLKDTKTVRLSSKPLRTRRSLQDPAFDLGIATEEVVEAVFAGSSFLPIMNSKQAPLLPAGSATPASSPTSAGSEISDPASKRKTCYIILDMAHEQDWAYCFPVGSWKRTVMNLFGNAIKYTHTGHITVSLHATDVARSTGTATTITLTVTDTGAGMSPAFLANKAFQPFSQENAHSSGVGLGLSIVRQIIENNGGKIEVSSDHASGTRIMVKLSLFRPYMAHTVLPQRTEYLSWLLRLKGRKVCILHRPQTNQDILDEPQNAEGLAQFTSALTRTLANHLKMNVVQTTQWHDNDADIMICPEVSFDYLASIRDKRAEIDAEKAPVTIFVALDALEAATLRSDVRVKSTESVVEIITQPLGPYKLAYVLDKCLDRLNHSAENTRRASATSPSQWQMGPDTEPNNSSLSPEEIPSPQDESRRHPTDKVKSSSSSATTRPIVTEGLDLPIRSESTISGARTDPQSTILITDDNAINRRLLVAFMKKNKLNYIEAENGLEALRTYQSSPQHIRVILMDMSMPVMDGMSATRAIRQYEQEYSIPRCSILALTGLASASAKLEAWNSGIDQFMTKPINFKSLQQSLEKLKAKKDGTEDASGTPDSTSASASALSWSGS